MLGVKGISYQEVGEFNDALEGQKSDRKDKIRVIEMEQECVENIIYSLQQENEECEILCYDEQNLTRLPIVVPENLRSISTPKSVETR